MLDEVLFAAKPARYAETHAGSAAYPMSYDAERQYGILGFLSRQIAFTHRIRREGDRRWRSLRPCFRCCS